MQTEAVIFYFWKRDHAVNGPQTTIAKITRPRLSRVFPRRRLFRLLDRSRGRPVIWVSGPAGSGKTTLVASYLDSRKLPCLWYQVDEGDADIATFFYYMGLAAEEAAPQERTPLPLLTREYLQGIPTFTRRYFENLYARFQPPFFIAIDNYQEVPEESSFHEVIQNGLSAVPPGINVIVISRSAPPPALTRLRASNTLEIIGWEELRFTLEEAKQIIRLKDKRKLTEDTIAELHEKTQGWAAGLVLLMERAKTEAVESQTLVSISREEIFDYFAGEIFNKLDGETRDFLLMTAFLPKMTVQAAEKLTGQSSAERILSRLSRNHFFTVKHPAPEPVYQYHPLFRAFLLVRIKEGLSQEGILHIQKRAAALLEESGQIEDAAELFIETKDWDGLIRMVLSHARALMKQGRSKTLETWLTSMPSGITENIPWLLYWLGMCRLPFNPAESRAHFEHAFRSFQRVGDDQGTLLAWSGAVDTFIYEFDEFTSLDPWLDWIEKRVRCSATFPSPEVEATVACSMVEALLWRRPRLPYIKKWIDRALLLSERIQNINLRMRACTLLAWWSTWSGDLGTAATVATEIKKLGRMPIASPLVEITWKAIETVMYSTTVFSDRSLRAATEGLEVSRKTGVHVWNSYIHSQQVYASLNKGDLKMAGDFLSKVEETLDHRRRNNVSHFHFLTGWYHLLLRDLPRASGHAEQSWDLVRKTGTPFLESLSRLLVARVFHARGEYYRALKYLMSAKRRARQIKSSFFEYVCLLTEAYFTLEQDAREKGNTNRKKRALNTLRKAMTIGRKQGYMTMLFLWSPFMLSRLCAVGLEAGIEVEYVRKLIRTLNLYLSFTRGETEGIWIEHWPWPLKIYTFGEFRIEKDGNPVSFSGKVKTKPLELLKALIAQGGREVREDWVTDALWEEAEGDAAHNAFKMTLSRLRQLIGNERAIQLQNKRLSLDPRYCWVDVWEFERICGQFEALWKDRESSAARRKQSRGTAVEAERLIQKAVGMYRGRFLADDMDLPWTVSIRERLRKKFFHLVAGLGRSLEQAGQWKKAAECYEKGLELDDLAEEFYQGLMVCYQRLGQEAKAVAVYNRCRSVLSAAFGISPSSKTETIYSALRQKK